MKYLVLICSLLVSMNTSAQEGSVEVYHTEIKEGVRIFGKNKNIYPVTIQLSAKTENMRSLKNLPLIKVIPGNREIALTDLVPVDDSKSWNMRYSYVFYMGSINAEHNPNFAYRLPFKKGQTYRLDQGFGGSFSHSGDSKYSLDFNMEIGTDIYAARAGLVVETEDRYTEGGGDRKFLEKANRILILHNDGTWAQYTHLKKNGVFVKVGDRVRAGQRIGASGATGYATGPHLHFSVMKTKPGGGFITIPVKFKTRKGIVMLKEGESYTGY